MTENIFIFDESKILNPEKIQTKSASSRHILFQMNKWFGIKKLDGEYIGFDDAPIIEQNAKSTR